MTDNIRTLSAAVPFQDTCGKPLSEVPGWQACADRLGEAYGLPPNSIRTQSQLMAALHGIDRIVERAKDLEDPKLAGAVLKAIEAVGDATTLFAQGAASILVKTTAGRDDLANKQATRLLTGLAEGKGDASVEEWEQLTRLMTHANANKEKP